MNELIINPDKIKIKKRIKYLFIAKWFLRFFSLKTLKKIDYNINKYENKVFDLKNEIRIYKKTKFIYKKLIKEIYPILNKLNKVNWSFKTWNFFIGHWLHTYISITLNRIHIIKNLDLKKINKKKIFNIGKKTYLTSYTQRDYTYNAALPAWNEKILSRIIYLISSGNFNNDINLYTAQKKIQSINDNFFKKLIFFFKILIIKFFERIFCFNNDFVFYNSYIKDKFLLFKILIYLKNFPFIYSFNFFNKYIVRKGFNYNQRKKIKLDLNTKDLDLKILKFLLPESLPTIYLEGFNFQKKISENSYLPKKIKKIFTSEAYIENSFKFWLANQINNGAKLYYGQHGAGYNLKKYFYGDYYEPEISHQSYAWGNRTIPSNKISIGNYLINSKNKKKLVFNNKYLLILETLETFKRGPEVRPGFYLNQQIQEIQNIVNNINTNSIGQLNIRSHPQSSRRVLRYENFLILNKKTKVLGINNFQNDSDKHSVLIFTYLSTEFFNQIALDKPCLLLMNKNLFQNTFTNVAKKDFGQLIKKEIIFFKGINLAKKINSLSENYFSLKKWWSNKNTKKIRSAFCKKYSNPDFNFKLFLNSLQKD